ncbi:MAG: hypothetical protein KDK44_02415 [Chlamydiia bacterium]|nr:hypothetical protein [Chlamydiia bacterium]MCP5509512.1 hypothetical protein [Chlamydiales bacterium]
MLIGFIFLLVAQAGVGTEAVIAAAGKAPSHNEAAAASGKSQNEDTILINPQNRANDWAQAYKFLTTRQSAIPVSFILTNGQKIENIVSVMVMSGGTLLAFQLNTPAGIKYEIVRVEDIAHIHQP